MPISRYQIRNPYGLADPELYRSADRDDPEAILEGVAMAGLVGILRQLGDLAEFAAEIFHDLHEEVMATAARGHGLTIRVQQVEAEFPSIEKALLSQTSHSHFTKNAGVEWHANLKMDQNLITTGDMPRFLMDSYEECRGPPRLFLLDKFDVAGAGACLKRYSDPSFFKTELAYSKKKKAEVQREIKARKGKKKGGRWRNGDTPEIFSTSHFNSTLRQLFSDENDNTSKKVPIHAVKLKRKHLNGFSLNSTNGRSYMEHILDISPAKNDVLYENSVHRTSELVPEVREIGMEDFARKLLQIEGTQIPSPKKQEIHEPSPDELCQGEVNEQALESMPEPATKFDEENIPSTLLQISQKDAIDDGERNIEAREIEVEKIPFAFHQEDENDELFKGESKMEDDANRYGYDETELDKLPPALSQVCQNVSDVDIESQTGAGADGEGSVEFEAEKIHATIYPVDQKDVLGAKSKIQGSDDEYGSDDEEKIHSVVYPVDQKDVLHDGESKTETSDGGYGSDDAASEIENYMDALTTMESEMETDTESRAKHEKSFLNVVNQGTDSDTNEEKHYLHDLPDALSIGNSSTLCDWNGSLKKQRFSCSDSDTLSNSADMQMLEGNGNASLDIHEKFEKLFKFEDAMSGPQNESSCFGFADKLPSPSNVDAAAEAYVSAKMSLTQVHDKSPEKLHDKSPEELTSIDVLGTKPSESLAPNGNGTELSEVPHFISESGEVSCSSCITKEAVTLIHSSPSASLSEIQLVGTDTTEISSSNTEAMGKHSGNDLLQMPEVSSVHYQMEEARVSDCSKSSSSCRLLDGEVHDVTSAALAHSSDISAMPQGVEDVEDCSAAARLIVGSLDCTSQATGISDLPLGTPDNTIPEKVPTGYIDDSSSAAGGENPTEEMLDLPNFKNSSIEEELLSSIKQDKDAYSDVTSPPECLSFTQMDTIDALPNSLSLEMESGVLPSGPAVNLWESAEFGELENQKTATGIVPYEYENSVTESHESDDVDASEVPAACGGMETLLFVEKEELCNASDIKVKDKPANFPSKSPNEVLPVEVLAHTNDSATRSVFKESDCNDQGRMVGSPASSDHHVWLQEESLPSETASDHCKIEISETPIREDNVALDAQRVTAFALSDYESNQQAVDLTDPAAQPGHIDSRDPIVSEFLNHAYHPLSFRDAQIHLHAIGDSDVSVPSRGGNQDLEQESRESNQALAPKSPDQNHPHQSEKDAVSPFTHFLPEPSVPLEKSLELKGGILDVASSNEEEEGLESSDLLRGRKESPKEMDPPITYEYDYSKVHTESSSVDHLVWQASESKLKSDSLAVAASGMINGPTISSLDVSPCTSLEPEACMQLPASHSNAMLELPVSLLDSDAMATSSPVFPTVSMCNPETTYELQMSRPILGFPLPEPNLLNHSLEDMPPLPPLPPLEWRIGKLRHGFLPFGGEDLHPTHPFLPVETIQAEKTQQPSNPFLPPHTVEVDKPEQPLNAFEPIPTKEDEKTLNDSITLWSEIVEPPNSFPRTENVADEELQHVSRAPVEEIGQPPKSSTTPPIVEDEKPLHGLQTLEGNVGQSTNPLVPPETIEEEKPNGVTQLEATRPRDPLIEAVAAHDRSMLRKVSEHLRKEVKPKSDERDSLLEQIRAKSFNLKPTAAVKPTIQGPRANLNVVAILEKANAIRQAFAGSDEDDDTDSWSDC